MTKKCSVMPKALAQSFLRFGKKIENKKAALKVKFIVSFSNLFRNLYAIYSLDAEINSA